jgi:hypothetical protein
MWTAKLGLAQGGVRLQNHIIAVSSPPMTIQSILKEAGRSALVQRAMRMLDDVEYRRIRTTEELADVIELRRKAYRARNVYVDPDQPMTDEQDLDPAFYTFAVFLEEQLVSTLRVHIVTISNRECNSRHYFAPTLDPLLDQGLTFMDPTRFAIDPDRSAELQGLPFVTLRLGFIAAKHFCTDFCLSMIKEQHEGFYRSVFRSTQLTPYMQFNAVHARYALFSSPKSMEEPICTRFPIFRSTATERSMLFDEPAAGRPRVLSVRPTARLAIRQLETEAHLHRAAAE